MLNMTETTIIGKSDLKASRLGFGCWQLGGHGWQNTDQKAITRAIHLALDQGINFFDTADIYGLGESERLLSNTIATSSLRHTAIIASKFGVRHGVNGTYYDNSKTWLFEAVEASLRRLQRETIDLYQLHWHDNKRPIDETLEDLEQLRVQGKIRWYGLSNIPPSVLDASNSLKGLVSYTLEYSLVQKQHEQDIVEAQNNLALSFIAWGALSQGLLTGKYNRNSTFAAGDVRGRPHSLFTNANWDYYDAVLIKLKEIAEKNNKQISQVALRFVLDYFPNSIILAGIKDGIQLQDNIGALGWSIPSKDRLELQRIVNSTKVKIDEKNA